MKLKLALAIASLFLQPAWATEAPVEPSAPPLALFGPEAVEPVRIVVAPGGFETPKAAAQELQRLVKAATGKEWPIEKAPAPDGVNVFVGPHPEAEAAGLRAGELPPEGYRLARRGRSVFIVGHDTKGDPWDLHWMRSCQTGTLFGVVEFARHFFHARWVLPGADGEVLRAPVETTLPEGWEVSGAPGFRSRKILHDTQVPEIARYLRFNRLGWSQVSCFWHNWYQTISPEEYSKEHPEWFALVRGVRATHLRNKSYDGQLCTSNPEVARKMADIAVEHYRENPGQTMFSISENDGGNHCQCAACRALDKEEWVPGLPSLSDRFAHFANAVRREIGERAPGLRLGYYAYHQGELPPVETRLEPGTVVSDVCNGYDVHYHFPKQREGRLAMMKGWRQTGAEVYMTTYFHGMAWWSLPMFSPEALAELIQTAAQHPSSSGFSLGLTDEGFGVSGNEFFLAAELLWNPKASVANVLADYYQSGFGPAAEPVSEYFELIRRSFAQAAKQLPPSADEKRPDTWVLATYEPIRQKADRQISAAREAAASSGDGALQRRVARVAEGWEWTKLQCDVMRAVAAYRAAPSKETAQAVLPLLVRRETMLQKHARPGNYVISVVDISATDKGRAFPVQRAEYEQALSGEIKTVRIPLEPKGHKPALLTMVENRQGGKPRHASRVALSVLRDRLEFAFELEEPTPERLLTSAQEQDGPVWKDDVVEIFLKPSRRASTCYQLLVNPAGVLADLRHEGQKADLSWNSGAKVSAQRGANGWRVKVSLPFASLGLESPPMPGDIWGLNVTRSRRVEGSEDSAWSPTFGLFLRPERFGELIFTKP